MSEALCKKCLSIKCPNCYTEAGDLCIKEFNPLIRYPSHFCTGRIVVAHKLHYHSPKESDEQED